MKQKIIHPCFLILLATFVSGVPLEGAFRISSEQPVSIVVAEEHPLTRLAAERLQDYVQAVTGARPVLRSGSAVGPSQLVLRLAAIPYFQDDGYRIQSDADRGSVLLEAPSPTGLKYAVQELILRMEQQGRELSIPALFLERNPWMKSRELFIAEIEWHPTQSEEKILDQLRERFSWLNWGEDRLRRYVDMAEAMGYNAIMLSDADLMRQYAGESTSAELALNKIQSMFKYARDERAMGTTFFIWAQKGSGERPVPNPRDPEQYAEMVNYWESMMDRYGTFVDKWILHWDDPGGCKLQDCTIYTPQAASNHFHQVLRGKGLQSDVSFSLWALRWGGWPGYEGWSSVVNSGILHPEIGINLMRHYHYAPAKAIADQYRMVGVWGWYANDMETNPGLHVHSKILENEFKRVHPTASVLVDWYSLEDNNHVLNLPSLYVGGRMLWDTETKGDDALLDFCRAVWGPAARPVFTGLRALEDVRSGEGVAMVDRDLWPDAYMTWLGRGGKYPVLDLAKCEQGLEALASVKIDPGFVPKIPLIAQPDELLEQIRAHLTYVRDFARIRVEYEKAMKESHSGRFREAREAMASLPILPDIVQGSYGAVEYRPYLILKDFADDWKGRTFSDNLALGRKVTASGWYKQDPRFAPEMAVNGLLCEFQEEGWAADTSGPAWVKIDLEKVQPVREVRIYNRGYHRDFWDNNLTATPLRAQVFYAENDDDPSSGTAAAGEQGYRLLGEFEGWEPTRDPAEYKAVSSGAPVTARFIKVVVYAAASGNATGVGEIEVR